MQFFPRQTMSVLTRGLEQAFAMFGGVPAELLFDQMKAVIIDDQRAVGGRLLENLEFLRFAEHWGFRVRACRPYRARTKGKVEHPISYVRQSFFYGREFLNDEDLNAQELAWATQTANLRLHRTIGESPVVRFERDELARLQPLALQPFAGSIASANIAAAPACAANRGAASTRCLQPARRSAVMSTVRSQREVIRGMLADLKMPGSLEAVDTIMSDIDGGRIAATEAINRLLSAQVNLRNNRRLQAAMRSSRLPSVKTLESFDFSFQPSIKREQIESLHELGFVDRKENIVLLGPPGVGKTHLAISLANDCVLI